MTATAGIVAGWANAILTGRTSAASCTQFNLIPQSPDHDQAIAGTAAVKRLLAPT